MTLGLILLEAEAEAVRLNILEDVMILMTFEPSFLPVESYRFWANRTIRFYLLFE